MNAKKMIRLGAVGLAMLALALLLALRYPLGPSLAIPRASWTSLVEPSFASALLHLAIYLGLTLLYLAAMNLLEPGPELDTDPASPAAMNLIEPGPENPTGRSVSLRAQVLLILAIWLACSAALLAVAPAGESHDIFDYIFRGRMMVEYQDNPLVDVPADYPLYTPYARYLAWRKNVDTYGPVWESASAAVALSVRTAARRLDMWNERVPVCPKSIESCRLLMAYISGYRLLAILLTGLAGALLATMVKRAWAALALAAWLLSPITLIASAAGGHNDAVMLVLAVFSWWLLQRRSPYLALLALILAAHVKLSALIWLPVCGLWILRKWGWKRALMTGLATLASGLALSWLLYAPFGGWQSLPRMLEERTLYMANSPWLVLKGLLVKYSAWDPVRARQFGISLSNGLFAVGGLLIPLWVFNFRPRRWRKAPSPDGISERSLWLALAAVSMLYLAAGSFWFQHWYVLWALAPAALLADSRPWRVVLAWLAFGALASNAAMDFLLNSSLKEAQALVQNSLSVAIIWSPAGLALALLALEKWKQARKRRQPSG